MDFNEVFGGVESRPRNNQLFWFLMDSLFTLEIPRDSQE